MQHPPPLLEEAHVGYLMGQGVLEGVFALGEQARLVEKLGCLEVRNTAMQRLLGHLGNGVQQGEGDLGANDRGGLEQMLVLGWQSVDTRRQHGLHGGRHLNARQGLRQAVRPALAHQDLALQQGAHALLQEKGIASGALDQQSLQRRQTGVLAYESLEQRLGARRGQRIKSKLRVERFTAPVVLVLRAVIDQQQEMRRRETLDQAVEQGLRFRINPVQVLEDQQHWLGLAFPQQQALEGLQGALAALRGIEGPNRTVLGEDFQERQHRRQRLLQGRVERQELSRDLGAHSA